MSFELIEAEKGNYPKALMCRALGLSRSGHHAFTTRGPSRRDLEDERLDVLVAALFAELRGRRASRRSCVGAGCIPARSESRAR